MVRRRAFAQRVGGRGAHRTPHQTEPHRTAPHRTAPHRTALTLTGSFSLRQAPTLLRGGGGMPGRGKTASFAACHVRFAFSLLQLPGLCSVVCPSSVSLRSHLPSCFFCFHLMGFLSAICCVLYACEPHWCACEPLGASHPLGLVSGLGVQSVRLRSPGCRECRLDHNESTRAQPDECDPQHMHTRKRGSGRGGL